MSELPKVLIVEDEAIIARGLRLQLKKCGFAVTGAVSSAADAFESIEDLKPDLVLMDIRIQGEMDGIEAAQAIRQRYTLPVIYLTAHADEKTLERAKLAQPFGYLLKPVEETQIKALATMVLHRHEAERRRESNRNMLSAILNSLPVAILVAASSGEVLFINEAAERLTGWLHEQSIGRNLADVTPFEDGNGRIISEDLIRDAVTTAGTLTIPSETCLLTRNHLLIPVAGELLATKFGERATGVFLTFQDIAGQKRESEKLSQEQQLFASCELARGIANEFFALFDFIGECAAEMREQSSFDAVAKIQQAARIGEGMTTDLRDFRESYGPAHVIDVHDALMRSEPLLRSYGGPHMAITVNSEPEVGCVLATGDHFSQLLMHLVLDSKERLGGCGKLRLSAENYKQKLSHHRKRCLVRLTARSERNGDEGFGAQDGGSFPWGSEPTHLSLSIIRVLATAAGGFTQRSPETDQISGLEVYLPRHEPRAASANFTLEAERTVLAVGLQSRALESVRIATAERGLLLEAASLNEAALIVDLYPGPIDLVIVNQASTTPDNTKIRCEQIRARRPGVGVMHVSSPPDGDGRDPHNPADLARQIRTFLGRNSLGAVSSGG